MRASGLTMAGQRRQIWSWIGWFAALYVVTLILFAAKEGPDQAHVVLAYLLLVLGGSTTGGRALGFALVAASVLLIDYYFQPPYDTFSVAKSPDWVVLIAFLAVASVTTQLLARARAEAAEARSRAEEVAALAVERVALVAEAEHAKALRETDRLRDVLMASLSHDLRTPLTAIKAMANQAAQRGDPNAPAIEAQTDLLTRLVGDLLDWSRIKTGAFPVDADINTAEDLIGAAVRQFVGAGPVAIVTNVDLDQPALIGRFDFVLSLRILTNLIENAIRYSPGSEPVELSASLDGEVLTFRVADRGLGIPVAERERIFEPFYRPANAPPDAGRAGLGLSIAQRLAEIQGGRVEYQPRPGGGSMFLLGLPAADIEPELE